MDLFKKKNMLINLKNRLKIKNIINFFKCKKILFLNYIYSQIKFDFFLCIICYMSR